jgi:predicted nucleic acid-binding Zn ribbon protein
MSKVAAPCKICGEEIPAGSRRWVYCSSRCQVMGMRIQNNKGKVPMKYYSVAEIGKVAGI